MVGFFTPHSKSQERNRTDPDCRLGESVQDSHTENDIKEEKCCQLPEIVKENSCEPPEEEENSDEEGWITPENFQQACEAMGGVLEEVPQSLAVGCITTDFAMQVNIHTQCSTYLICTPLMYWFRMCCFKWGSM